MSNTQEEEEEVKEEEKNYLITDGNIWFQPQGQPITIVV